MKSKLLLFTAMTAAVILSGCARFNVGTGEEPPDFSFKGWGKAYARISEIPEYNGTILDIQLFRSDPHTGELLDISLWPLLEFDIGLLGVRGKILAAEAAAGTLFYYPSQEGDAIDGLDASAEE